MVLSAGDFVTSALQLVAPLARGGMSTVWVADHLELGTQVAVKFLSSEQVSATTETLLKRFRAEADATAQLRSPHVVRLVDFGVYYERPFIVMELLRGETLGQRLLRDKRLDFDTTCRIVSHIASALSEAHALGIIHRDIKADNLFLTEQDGQGLFVKVLDFGVAKLDAGAGAQRITRTGAVVGSPKYMSPEQLLNAKSVDAQADLWALSVLTYRCVAGVFPFAGKSLVALCAAITRARYPPLTGIEPDLALALDAFFARAFARNPRRRFASALELSQALCSVGRPSVRPG